MLKKGIKLTLHHFPSAKIAKAHLEKADFRGSKITKILQIFISKRSPDFPETFGSLPGVETRLMMDLWRALSVYFPAQLKFLQSNAQKSSKSAPVCKKPENCRLLICRVECAKSEHFLPF